MNTSDIIAIIAIISSAIVSTIATYSAYLNNKLSINARRREIALSRQIDAFTELAEKLTRLQAVITDDTVPASKKSYLASLDSVHDDFTSTYTKLRLFFPPEVTYPLGKYQTYYYLYRNDISRNFTHRALRTSLTEWEKEVIRGMSTYLGIH